MNLNTQPIKVVYPNGGEKFEAGRSITIKWRTRDKANL